MTSNIRRNVILNYSLFVILILSLVFTPFVRISWHQQAASPAPGLQRASAVEAPPSIEARLGPHSVADIETEGRGVLEITLEGADLPNGKYDVRLICNETHIEKLFSQGFEVLNGLGGNEFQLNLPDGRYADCRTQVDGLGGDLPPFTISFGQGLGGWEYIDRVMGLLDSAVEKYATGDQAQSRNLVIEAYNSNFELIDQDILEDNLELKEKLEKEISQDLIKMIDDKRPASEFKAKVDEIKLELNSARAIVT